MKRLVSFICIAFSTALAHAADVDEFAVSRRAAYWDNIFRWSYAAYFILFGIAAGLAVFAVLAGRRRFNVVFSLSFALLLMLCAVSIQTGIDQKRGFIADQELRYEATMKNLSKTHNKEELLRAEYMYLP